MPCPMNGAMFYPLPLALAERPEAMLWGLLRLRMSEDGGPAWPSQARLAADLKVTERTIVRWTRYLEREGWLWIERPAAAPQHGRGHVIRYWAILASREAVVEGRITPRNPDARVRVSGKKPCHGCPQTLTPMSGQTLTPVSGHKDKRISEEIQEESVGPAALPSGPPPAADGDGNGNGRSLAELRAMLAGFQKPFLPDGGATGRRIAAEIAEIEAGAAGQDAPAVLPGKRPAAAPACLADDPDVLRLAEALLVA